MEGAKCSILEYKLRKFAGRYDQILDKHIDLVLFDFKNCKEDEAKEDLIEDFMRLSNYDYITPMDISEVVIQLGIRLDTKILCTLLLRNSLSVHQIKGRVIESYLIPKLRGKVRIKLKHLKNAKHLFAKIETLRRDLSNDLSPESQIKAKKNVLFKIADCLFSKNQSLMDILHKKIHDKVIDGKEYQLIKRKSLINSLSSFGIAMNYEDVQYFKDLIRPVIQDFVDVRVVLDIMNDLGISENLPPSNKHMDYKKLEGPSIRIFNRIINYMKTNEIMDIINFLNKENLDLIEVVGKDKQDTIETIQALKLRDILRDKDIINYGEELDDNFIEFLEVSPQYNDIIMIRKLKKAIKQIKECKYFQYFGDEKRVGEPDAESTLIPVNKGIA